MKRTLDVRVFTSAFFPWLTNCSESTGFHPHNHCVLKAACFRLPCGLEESTAAEDTWIYQEQKCEFSNRLRYSAGGRYPPLKLTFFWVYALSKRRIRESEREDTDEYQPVELEHWSRVSKNAFVDQGQSSLGLVPLLNYDPKYNWQRRLQKNIPACRFQSRYSRSYQFLHLGCDINASLCESRLISLKWPIKMRCPRKCWEVRFAGFFWLEVACGAETRHTYSNRRTYFSKSWKGSVNEGFISRLNEACM